MAIKDCIEHLYSWDYTIKDAYGCPGCVERERIIKLLENHFEDTTLWRQVEWSPDVYEGFNKQELIALIKGENK